MNIDLVKAQAEKLGRQLIAERCKVDLYYLCKYVLGMEEVLDPKVHGPLCQSMRPLLFYKNPQEYYEHEYPSDWGREEEQGLPTEKEKAEFLEWQKLFEPTVGDAHTVADKLDPEIAALLALMPRGTLKSSIITIGFTLQWFLNFPEDRVLIDSEVFTKSTGFLTEIKGHAVTNQKYRDIFYTIHGVFPDANKRHDKWSDREVNFACRTKARKEPSIDCAGIDVTKNGFHYDLVIMDDLHSEKNTKSVEQIDQVKEHFRLVYSLLDPGKPKVVVGTRWDYADLYQMIIDDLQEEFNFMTRSALGPDDELFYPKRLNHKELATFRKIQKAFIFSCQYLNNPVDDQNAEFQRSYFKYCTLAEAKAKGLYLYGMVDPTEGGEHADFAGIVVGGMDSHGELYFVHGIRRKMKKSEIFKLMYALQDQYPEIKGWSLEVAAQPAIMSSFKQFQLDKIKQGKRPLNVTYLKSRPKSKEDRIRGLVPYYELGRAWHVTNANDLDKLETELVKFPKAPNDDISDAWADILQIGKPSSGAVMDPEKEEKRKAKLRKLNKPRSPMVGY